MFQPEVVFIYDHFYPDYGAGGPVRSLDNLARLINNKLKIGVVCSAYEYGSGKLIEGVKTNSWYKWKDISVWYATDKQGIGRALDTAQSDKGVRVYLNGLFSVKYFLYPLYLSHILNFKVIITPRGMLQSGALERGKLKKKVYLNLVKLSGLLKNVSWQATDLQESEDIKTFVGSYIYVDVIPDIPTIPQTKSHHISKERGMLNLVYFSLITEKKNLLFILELLFLPELKNIRLDIIGPVKDETYWQQCQKVINQLPDPGKVSYRLKIAPDQVHLALQNYHALVLPTKGENFGHAIVETLSTFRPVIISDKTPWNDVANYGAGYAIRLEKTKWVEALHSLIQWDQNEFDNACSAASKYYLEKFDLSDLEIRYLNLFTR